MNVGDLLKLKGLSAITILPEDTIANAARRLKQDKIGALVVSTDGSTIEGIISERDITYALPEHLEKLPTLQVWQLMSRNVVTCTANDSMAEVSKVMTWRGFRHLPVVENGKLVGMISSRDVLRNRIADLKRLSDLLRDCLVANE